jgi:hypothetical protein
LTLIVYLDAKKRIVQQRGGDLEFFDDVHDYIHDKSGLVNWVENRNSCSVHIDKKKGILIEKMITRLTI